MYIRKQAFEISETKNKTKVEKDNYNTYKAQLCTEASVSMTMTVDLVTGEVSRHWHNRVNNR